MRYWAAYPKSHSVSYCRIEKAASALEAIRKAFGLTPDKGRWLAKDMGSTVAIIQSNPKRLALLNDPTGWIDPIS
jgi:hypothetical protein